MSEAVVLYEVREHVAHVTLNRPDKRNALNGAVVEALADALDRSAADAEVHVVLLRGAGPDFCSGADLAELDRIAEMGEAESLADARRLGDLFMSLREHPRPIVAAIHGRALAGGCGLATACDLVIASEDAELGYPEVHLGFVPALVMTILRRKVGEAVAFELVTRGERISSGRAVELGLVSRTFPTGEFEAEAERYVEELAKRPPSAIELSKALLYELDELSFEGGLERAAEVNAEARRTEACREGVRLFLERSKHHD